MEKWADYCINKLTFQQNGKLIERVSIMDDQGESLSNPYVKDRNWMVSQINAGKSFCAIQRNFKSSWTKVTDFNYTNDLFTWGFRLPLELTRRKTFLSYYHEDNQAEKENFESRFGDLIVNKSVKDGDIDSDNKDEYVKQLIQQGYLSDTTVMVVLVGANTKSRKHIDWEISGALDVKVGENYAGLIGILLPDNPSYNKEEPDLTDLPERLAANVKSGYARLYKWSDNIAVVQSWIEDAYSARNTRAELRINRAIKQRQQNSTS